MAHDVSFKEIQKSYFKVFIALLLLTGLTVAVTTVHFGDTLNIVVGILIAALKASLVAYIFMHLKFDHRRLRLFVYIPLVFFGVMVFALTVLGL